MNDRLKFRVWDEKRKLYVLPDDLSIDMDGQLWENCTQLDNSDEHLIIEQCTGLKGKNGKLIFEGDVFEADVLNSYDGDSMVGKRIRGQVAYFTGSACFTFAAYAPINLGQIEIIGNIHNIKESNL